jgi:hypothetical protein
MPNSVVSRRELGDAITSAGAYLSRACSKEGKFVYQVETGSGTVDPSYEIVRHAGAMYSLGSLDREQHNAETARTITNAAAFLEHNYVGPGVRTGQIAVWGRPFPEPSDAELGATALGMLALLEARRIDQHIVSLEDLQGMGRTILFLQRDDGSFIHRYRPGVGPDLNWHSLFYPGEAALALVSLYEVDHNSEWLEAAGKALAYLARTRSGSTKVPRDHWALIATAELLPYCERNECKVTRAELVGHAVQICNELLSSQQLALGDPALDGSFDAPGRIAIAAASLEGLLAAYEFLPPEERELRTRIQAAATRGIDFLLRAQIKSGPYAGGMPLTSIPEKSGGSIIRIDFVQHSLSAWIRYRRLFCSK